MEDTVRDARFVAGHCRMKIVIGLCGVAAAGNPLSAGSENLPDKFAHEVVKGYPVINVSYEFPAISKDAARKLHAAEADSASLAQLLMLESKAVQREHRIASMLSSNGSFLSSFPGAADSGVGGDAGSDALSSIIDKAGELNRTGEEAAAPSAVDEEIQSKQGDVTSKLKAVAATFDGIGSFISENRARSAQDTSELMIGLGEIPAPPTKAFGRSYIDPTKGHSWSSCDMNFAGCPQNFALNASGRCMPRSSYEGPCDGENFSEFTAEMMQLWASRCKTQWACA